MGHRPMATARNSPRNTQLAAHFRVLYYDDMKADDNDKLWELLGEARPPAVSPFFARNVLRAVRQEEEARPPLARITRAVRRWAWQFALAGTCAIAALVAVHPSVFARHHHTVNVESGLTKQIVGNPDYEVINHLDELVADEESSLWLDDSAH
jgi:hypothetical protein